MTQPEFLTGPDLARAALHGFFTRRGGVSVGPYASLNGSLSGADDRSAVLENRARAARAIGGTAAGLVGVSQVHGVEVATVIEAWAPGSGPRADGMVTRLPGLCLAVVTADCAPVLLADPEHGVVGAAHAGWRGAVAGVLEATVTAMMALGARPESTVAAVGPCIGQPSYEVGADLRAAVLTRDPADRMFFTDGRRPDRWQFDLGGYCASRLRSCRIAVEHLAADTAARPDDFFSHRRRTLAGGGAIGHQISVIRCPIS